MQDKYETVVNGWTLSTGTGKSGVALPAENLPAPKKFGPLLGLAAVKMWLAFFNNLVGMT